MAIQQKLTPPELLFSVFAGCCTQRFAFSLSHRHGYFRGINRKVQLKSMTDNRYNDLATKFKDRNENTNVGKHSESLLLILKWGGELTPMGEKQAEDLGRAFRSVYPGRQGNSFSSCSLKHATTACMDVETTLEKRFVVSFLNHFHFY